MADAGVEVTKMVLGKVLDVLSTAIGRQINFLCHYKDNLTSLKGTTDDLKGEREQMEVRINEARGRGDIIEGDVRTWITSMENMTKEVQDFLHVEEVAAGKMVYLHLRSRLRSSKEATKKASKVINLQNKADRFKTVARATPPLGIYAYKSINIDAYVSQKKAMDDAIDALKDERFHIVALCGPGGTGKTTVVKELGKRMKSNKEFDEVVLVVVSQPVDKSRIQDDLAGLLGMDKLPVDASRRERLWARLDKGNKILLILDDVWSTLDLEELGIPIRKHGHSSGCKVLLTSRNESECLSMGAHGVTLSRMQEDEAWLLFKEVVHEVFEVDLDKDQTEGKIFHECGRLPLTILVVGKTLRKEKKKDWVLVYVAWVLLPLAAPMSDTCRTRVRHSVLWGAYPEKL